MTVLKGGEPISISLERYGKISVNGKTLRLECHRGDSGFDAIFDDWCDLMGRIQQQNFYHHPFWFRAYLRARPDYDDKFTFSCVYRGSALVGVFPTIANCDPDNGAVVAELPVGDELFMADCAIADNEDGGEIYDFYRKSLETVTGKPWDVYRATYVLRDGHLGSAILKRSPLNCTLFAQGRCAEIPIGDYDQAIASLKKKFRGNLNNAKHKLERAGEARYVVERSVPRVRGMFDQFIELEMAGWKGDPSKPRDDYTTPSAIGLKESKLRFYTGMIEQFADAGCAEISQLWLDDRLIGSLVCLLLNDTCYMIKVAYSEEAGRYSPGHLLIDRAYQRYADEGRITRINMITAYPWVRGWEPHYRDYVVFRDFNLTARGAFAFLRSKLGLIRRDYLTSRQSGRHHEPIKK